MTYDDLRAKIIEMAGGSYASIPYELYERLFPPGEPDQAAREACFNFAKAHGCRIENKPSFREVWIIKDPATD